MKTTKKFLALVLALAMVLSLTAVSAFAAQKTNKYDYNNDGKVVYTVLGDSISAGFAMPGFYEGSKWEASAPLIDGSFPALVGNALNADVVHQDAHIGLRSTDLRYLLCEDYAGDVAVGWRVPTTDENRTIDLAGVEKVRAEYKQHIQEADVITLNIGINDLTIPIGILDIVHQDNLQLLSQWGNMLNSAYQLAGNTAYMAQVTTLLFGFYRNYISNFDAIVTKIKELNPDAKLLVIGYYNAAQDAYAKGALPVDIGALVTPFIDLFNSHAAGAAAGNGYTFVKMEHIDTLFCDPTSSGYLNDTHPTAYGHQQMADNIMAAIDA